MIEMKVEDRQPFLRNGNKTWCKPIVDEKGMFFFSQKAACEKLGLTQAQVSLAVVHGTKTGDGKKFRIAKVSEVREHLGDKVTMYTDDGAKKPKKAAKAAKKSKKGAKAATIEVDGELKPLKREQFVFEGHEFTGGLVVVVLPGTAFRIERASRSELPAELAALCRWA